MCLIKIKKKTKNQKQKTNLNTSHLKIDNNFLEYFKTVNE